MTVLVSKIITSQYYDSALLMQLQKSLAKLSGVLDVGVVMGTGSNKSVLVQSGLNTPEADKASAEDLIIVIKANNDDNAQKALVQIGELLSATKSTKTGSYRPKSLENALKLAPQANWVFVSVNGKYASEIVDRSLDADKNVFLFSDNISVDEELRLKQKSLSKGLMVLGPDCGTSIINGIGFGFSNQVARGGIGIVAASGTGLQAVTVAIDDLGAGVSHAIGTGGRDLKESVGAITCLQALSFLEQDSKTEVIVLVSKPPAKTIASKLLQELQTLSKPVIVFFIGDKPPARQIGNINFALSLRDAASLAVSAYNAKTGNKDSKINNKNNVRLKSLQKKQPQKYVRGLFSGGTLAYEVMGTLKGILPEIYSNIPLDKNFLLKDVFKSQEHTILDLGEDEFTVGKLHPMMDNDFRIRRLLSEAEDKNVAIILLDVVLGFCSNQDSAGELSQAVGIAKAAAKKQGRELAVIALVVGSANDPQNRDDQIKQLENAGVIIVNNSEDLAFRVSQMLPCEQDNLADYAINSNGLTDQIHVINVGLEVFSEALQTQDVKVLQVDWSPPANGNERLAKLLNKLKG